jgi:hypothetical protein
MTVLSSVAGVGRSLPPFEPGRATLPLLYSWRHIGPLLLAGVRVAFWCLLFLLWLSRYELGQPM